MSGGQDEFKIRFWGVRGSIPSPGPETIRYGGNTPCVEMQVNGQRLIFDGGTGLRALGRSLKGQSSLTAHLFFSHYHWDHVQGFPFFEPAFLPSNRFHIYGAIALDGSTIEQRLALQMLHPNFPVPLQIMSSNLMFHDISPGDSLNLGHGIAIATASLNHPGESVGYRVSCSGYIAAYVTDTEHLTDGLDENVLRLAHQADVLIYDSTYTNEEYHHPHTPKLGWGHSTWQEAVKVAQAAGVKRLVIFHHDPSHDDEFLDEVSRLAQLAMPNSQLAYEGLELNLVSVVPFHASLENPLDANSVERLVSG